MRWLLASNSLAASTASAPGAAPALPSGAMLFANLLMVVIAILAAAWLVKRLKRHVPGASNDGIRVVATCALGHRERIAVVAIGEEQIVVGISAGGMVRLHEMQTPIAEAEDGASLPFAARLRDLKRHVSERANS